MPLGKRSKTFFDPASREPPPEPPKPVAPRDPVEVRKDLRRGALGFACLAVGAVGLAAFWAVRTQAQFEGQEWSWVWYLAAGLGIAGIAVGSLLAPQAWNNIPPRSARTSTPGSVALVQVLVVFVYWALQQWELVGALPSSLTYLLGLGGLAVHFLLAAWAVLALPWDPRVPVSVLLAVGGLLYIPITLMAMKLVTLPHDVHIAVIVAAAAASAPALVALSVATLRAARLATDEQLI